MQERIPYAKSMTTKPIRRQDLKQRPYDLLGIGVPA